jgi:hypothetical protein
MELMAMELKSSQWHKGCVRLALLALSFLAGSDVLAHGGGLNAQGCHNERRTGGYHCHRSQPVSTPAPNQLVAIEPSTKRRSQQLLAQPQEQRLPTNDSGRPTCYTGPRGGTYTLTASGRKNYSGC